MLKRPLGAPTRPAKKVAWPDAEATINLRRSLALVDKTTGNRPVLGSPSFTGVGGGGRGRQNLGREGLAKADQSSNRNTLENSEDSKWDAVGSPIPTTGSGSETGSPSRDGGIGKEHRIRDKQTYPSVLHDKAAERPLFLCWVFPEQR